MSIYTIFVAARLGRAMGSEHADSSIMNRVHAVPFHAIILVGGVAAIVTYVLLWRSSTLWLNVCPLRDLLSGLPQGKLPSHFKVSEAIDLCSVLFSENGRRWNNAMIRSAPLFYPSICFCLETAKWAALK